MEGTAPNRMERVTTGVGDGVAACVFVRVIFREAGDAVAVASADGDGAPVGVKVPAFGGTKNTLPGCRLRMSSQVMPLSSSMAGIFSQV